MFSADGHTPANHPLKGSSLPAGQPTGPGGGPVNAPPVPVAPATCQTGTGAMGTGALRGRGGYGGWAYGVPVRTGVRDLKTGALVNPAARESSHLPLARRALSRGYGAP